MQENRKNQELLNQDYTIGLESMDEEHKVLISAIKDAMELLEDDNMLYKDDEVYKLLSRLEDYIKMHFSHEEEYMEEVGYPGLEDQKIQHRQFVKRLEEFNESAETMKLDNQNEVIGELLDYLLEWISWHIKEEDKKYVSF